MKYLPGVLLALSFVTVAPPAIAQYSEGLGFRLSSMQSGIPEFIELKNPLTIDGVSVKVIKVSQPINHVQSPLLEFGLLDEQANFVSQASRSYKIINNEIMVELTDEVLKINQERTVLSYQNRIASIKPMQLKEGQLGIRPQLIGLNHHPEVHILKEALAINGEKYQSIRLIKDAGKNQYTVRFGKLGIESNRIILQEEVILASKAIPSKSLGGILIEIEKGVNIELYKDHVLVQGERIAASPYSTYKNDKGYRLASNYKAEPKLPTTKPIKNLSHIRSIGVQTLVIAAATLALLPENNPFAEAKGLDCSDTARAKNKIRCEEDSILNPFNNVVNCTEILNYWQLDDDRSMCGAKVRYYSFRVEKDSGMNFLKGQGFMSKSGSSAFKTIPLKERKELLRDKLGTRIIDTEEKTFPEGQEIY
jgi:hypothetical protein